ncbi:MAG: sensor histidine kinase [Planctomycetota bacterium]
MVQLVTRRSALFLYGVLLVLPTVVFGGLLWLQLEKDYRTQMAAIPGDTNDAARRLSDAIEQRFEDFLERENQRPFYAYKRLYFQPGTIGTDLALSPSPLATGPAPGGILAWFNCTFKSSSPTEPDIEIFSGGRDAQPGWAERRTDLEQATAQLVWHDLGEAQEYFLSRFTRLGAMRIDKLALPVAAINASQEEDIECLISELPALRGLQDEVQEIQVFSFHCRFYRDKDGTPRVVGARSVIIGRNARLREMPSCFENIEWGVHMVQGFFIDPEWLFERLPTGLASQILDSSQQFFVSGVTTRDEVEVPRTWLQAGSVHAEIRPIAELGFETYAKEDADYGVLRVVANPHEIEDRYSSQRLHLLGVAGMLVLSLGTGLALLLRSVRRDLEAAQRTENFVAAITHELRTPLSAIRMHGEMLQDGWIRDDDKRSEYYRRIVRETNRLETLVERVLEKSRLATSTARPEPGDLNDVVSSLEPSLLGSRSAQPAQDVVFDLAPDLPDALIVPDGVRSIVTNLVENARKYAPVSSNPAGAEPIRVATFLANGHPVLEVSDRGPGIPREERSRVFDAFYRVGNESTRTTKGTGLGLHLVALHCQTMNAAVQVLDREGGGTVFRVTFMQVKDSGGQAAVA